MNIAPPLDPRWRERAPADWLEYWSPFPLALAGGEVEAIECGEGPPLVLLPPLPGWKEAFVALVPLLARHFRVLTFDLRSRFAGPANWPALVADVDEAIRGRFDRPVAVLGHSFGAALAIGWALERPERSRALILSSGFARVFTPPGAGVARYVEQPLALAGMRWLPDGASAALARRLAARRAWVFDAHSKGSALELVRFGIRRVPLALIRQRVRLALGLDLRARLGELRCPTLVVAGERDTPFARAASDELAARILGAERRRIPDAGHLHPLTMPSSLATLAGEWLAGIPGR